MKGAIIYTTGQTNEIHYPNYQFCKKYNHLWQLRMNKSVLPEEQIKYREILAHKLELNLNILPLISDIWDEIHVLSGHYANIPIKFHRHLNFIEQYALSSFKFQYLPKSIYYGCGLALKKIINILKDSTQNNKFKNEY
ncbi:hypothetical protein MXB_5422 [Myxobolus squamalis]|nr:hypothetical protein MXB_5422 [Myxobolus squamalis]